MIEMSIHLQYTRLPQAVAALRSGLPQVVGETTRAVTTFAQGYAPIDTGELHDSIGGQSSGLSGQAVAGTDHAIHQEFGTRYQSGTPFMRPGAEAARPGLEAAVRSLLGRLA